VELRHEDNDNGLFNYLGASLNVDNVFDFDTIKNYVTVDCSSKYWGDRDPISILNRKLETTFGTNSSNTNKENISIKLLTHKINLTS